MFVKYRYLNPDSDCLLRPGQFHQCRIPDRERFWFGIERSDTLIDLKLKIQDQERILADQ